MVELLQKYSIAQIMAIVITLALAIKSLITFFDWVYERIKKVFNTQHEELNAKEQLNNRLQCEKKAIDELKLKQQKTDILLTQMSKKIDTLINSDKQAIKAYITRQHHYFCYKIKSIDDFSLDCLERRYQHYTEQGGNSFIEGFMKELRALPRQSAKDQYK